MFLTAIRRRLFTAETPIVQADPIFKVPSAAWFSENIPPHTPDIGKLQQYQWQRLFLIGDDKPGFPRHDLLGSQVVQVCPAFTQDEYTTWVKKLGPLSFPIPLAEPHANGTWRTRVKGEIVLIRPTQFLLLDRLRENGVQFDRVRVPLIIPFTRRALVEQIEETVNNGPVNFPDRLRDDAQYDARKSQSSLPYLNEQMREQSYITIRAWMYVGKYDFWDPLIDGGFLFRAARVYPKPPYKIIYSHFSKLDLNE